MTSIAFPSGPPHRSGRLHDSGHRHHSEGRRLPGSRVSGPPPLVRLGAAAVRAALVIAVLCAVLAWASPR